MKIALIHSRDDLAGVNIHAHIQELLECQAERQFPFTEHDCQMIEVCGRLIDKDGIDQDLDTDTIFFLSRHSSKRPVPVLTVHVTGNFRSAELGGMPRSLAPSAAGWMHAILNRLSHYAPPGYGVSYEVTHHGPTELSTPSLFVEIGSTEKEWCDQAAGKAVAESILTASLSGTINLIGFGGTHYARRQTEIALKSRGAFGHIAHSREVPYIDAGLVALMQEKTGAVAAYIDKKAISREDFERIGALMESRNLIRLGEKDLIGLGSIPWSTYLQIRELAGKIEPGARCGFHSLEGAGVPVILTLNEELVSEAMKADSSGFISGLDRMPVVHIITAKQPVSPVFITYREKKSEVLHDLITLCVTILSSKEHIAIEGDCLTIRKKQFDPLEARELGVPAGPLFGRLRNGHSIEIDGRTVTPAMVQIESIKKIHIPGLGRFV